MRHTYYEEISTCVLEQQLTLAFKIILQVVEKEIQYYNKFLIICCKVQ